MKKICIIVAIILSVLLFVGPFSIAKQMIFPTKYKVQANRIQSNTLTTNRIVGNTSENLGLQVAKTVYPIENYGEKPQSLILLQSDKWQDVLALMPAVNAYKGLILPVKEELTSNMLEYVEKILPLGVSELQGTQVLVFGNDMKKIKTQLDKITLKTLYINYKDTNDLQSKIYNLHGVSNSIKYGFIVKDNDPLVSIPTSTWISNQGGAILYADHKDNLYDSSRKFLLNNKLKKVYLVCDKKTDGNKILNGLKVKNDTLISFNKEKLAIKFAKFHDKKEFVGWNLDRKTKDSGHNYILCSKNQPMLAIISSQLSSKGKVGPILWTDKDKLSSITENYLWRMKPNYHISPLEGPYNTIWVIGDEDIISYETQTRADYTQHIASYKMMGEQGISGIDAVSIIYILISIFGSIWAGVHLFTRMHYLSTVTKLMWILSILILGPVGLWIYIISYVNCPWMKINNKVMWMRPIWKQVLVADVTGLSFSAALIIGICYLTTFMGVPIIIFPESSGVFLLGNPIFILMLANYIIAFVLNLYIFIPYTFMEIKDISYRHAKKESVIVTFVSVTSMFIGMALIMWWLNMSYAPRVPEEDYILWWGFMQLSALVGGIISYIPTWLLIKNGKQIGTA